jgi:hypothetical protein
MFIPPHIRGAYDTPLKIPALKGRFGISKERPKEENPLTDKPFLFPYGSIYRTQRFL